MKGAKEQRTRRWQRPREETVSVRMREEGTRVQGEISAGGAAHSSFASVESNGQMKVRTVVPPEVPHDTRICIEDLLEKINTNMNIKGYTLNILDTIQIKCKAYADDVTCFTQDEFSTSEILLEFEKWGNYSGSSINKEKTQILCVNTVIEKNSKLNKFNENEVKIFGILFNKFGVSANSYIHAKEKFYKSLTLWINCPLDMIQRITAIKTYIMSKLWFVLKFFIIEEKEIKVLEKDIFHFIWKGNREFISRKQLMKKKEEGGLNMFCLRSTLKAIYIKYFYDFIINHYRHEYQFCVIISKMN